MWASDSADAANAAEVAGEEAIAEIINSPLHLCSPSASGRVAMRVYHEVFNKTADAHMASYFAEWWATDGGDLESVPDGTPSPYGQGYSED